MTATRDALLITEAQCAARVGLPARDFERAVTAWTRKGFPLPCPVTGRLYWPAVQAFLDRHYGVAPLRSTPAPIATVPDGEENPDALRHPKHRRTRP
jgi:hypothetical protein